MVSFIGHKQSAGNMKKEGNKAEKPSNIFGPVLSVYGLPVDRNIIFSNHKQVYRKKIEKRQRKLLAKISFLKFFLHHDETILMLTTGYSQIKFWEQLLTFPTFLFFKKAIFVFTTKRLFLIPASFKYDYRQTQLQIPYADCHSMAIKGRALVMDCKDGERKVFHYIGSLELKKLRHLIRHLPIMEGIKPEIAIRHLCPSCSNILPFDNKQCSKCNLKFKDQYHAIFKAVLLPGGGFFYSRHPVYGTMMGIIEILMIGAIAFASLALSKDFSHTNLVLLLLIAMALVSIKVINAYHAGILVEHPIPEQKEFDRRKI
ncbi:MAG: hypothetical protein PVI90_17240 [Desulfobacteraceae bacterium]|jgi:hypothetical protein